MFSKKHSVDLLFTVHAAFALIAGLFAILLPHFFEHFMISFHEDGSGGFHPGGEAKITHLVIRLYGALILAQSWIVWHARTQATGAMRRALVQAYFGMFTITALALLRAQLTTGGGFNAFNWLNIILFAGLAGYYGWWIFVQPLSVWELPMRATV